MTPGIWPQRPVHGGWNRLCSRLLLLHTWACLAMQKPRSIEGSPWISVPCRAYFTKATTKANVVVSTCPRDTWLKLSGARGFSPTRTPQLKQLLPCMQPQKSWQQLASTLIHEVSHGPKRALAIPRVDALLDTNKARHDAVHRRQTRSKLGVQGRI